MAPMYGQPNYSFFDSEEADSGDSADIKPDTSLTHMAFWYMIVLISMLLLWLFMFFCLRIIGLRQKTRNPQQRRVYVGSRPRQSLGPQEPTIYVSPSNLPPPPKYECMAPPSYEEVVGVHYPNYNIQPIVQPISTALAQGSQTNATLADATVVGNAPFADATATNTVPLTSVTVATEDRRTSLTVAARS